MKARMRLVVGLAVAILVSGCTQQRGTAFGEPLAEAAPAVDVAVVLASPAKYDGQKTRMHGVVTEVCSQKGCWLRLGPAAGGEDAVFVKFTCPVEGRLIPMEAVGRHATVEGEITMVELSVDEARHYAEDAGKSAEEIAAITEPQVQVRATSPGALVELN